MSAAALSRPQRLAAVRAALRLLAAHPDPALLGDGLSPAMAAHCLGLACEALDPASLERATEVPGAPPALAAVVSARGVFTAPLEWVAVLAAAGAEVILKPPRAAPHFAEAISTCFRQAGLPVRVSTERALPAVDALVVMGSDETVAALAAQHARARLSLHGHRFSLAVVRGCDEQLARGLALDALLYDGRGCFTPAGVLVLGEREDAAKLTRAISDQLEALSRQLPPGASDPLWGPERRRRTGLARTLGWPVVPGPPTCALLPPEHFEAAVLPGFLPVHPVPDTHAVSALLADWRPWLAACATDLDDPEPLLRAGFERVCRPGHLQRPPLLRAHGGRELLRPLMRHASVELGPEEPVSPGGTAPRPT
jgi:hypothetical protein